MKLPIRAQFKLCGNDGSVLRTVERLSVIDTEMSLEELNELLSQWGFETGQVFAIAIDLANQDKKKLRREILKAQLSNGITAETATKAAR